MNAKEKKFQWFQENKARLDANAKEYRERFSLIEVEAEDNSGDFALMDDDLRTNEPCPQCQCLGTYRRYAHLRTSEYLPKPVGKCNREVCGYDYSAKRHLAMEKKKTNITNPETVQTL